MLNVVQLEQQGRPIRLSEAADDYEIVRRTLAFITDHWRRQPSVEEMAGHVGLSAGHLHHLFRRWAGLTPKDFLQAITLDAARALLRDEATVLDTAFE
ncbi:MAG: AraC family transcriptional regulator, partial [Phreatobacter sp.]|nr:AraC family transcriptional regulator [Phreatobacter sp.]